MSKCSFLWFLPPSLSFSYILSCPTYNVEQKSVFSVYISIVTWTRRMLLNWFFQWSLFSWVQYASCYSLEARGLSSFQRLLIQKACSRHPRLALQPFLGVWFTWASSALTAWSNSSWNLHRVGTGSWAPASSLVDSLSLCCIICHCGRSLSLISFHRRSREVLPEVISLFY